MNVTLTPTVEEFIRNRVENGSYASESEVVREALRQMQLRDQRIDWLRAEVQIGIDSAERGALIEFNETFMENILNEVREKHRARSRVSGSAGA